MKVGIIGAGAIAGTMAGTIREMDCAQITRWLPGIMEGQLNLRKRMVLKSLWILRGTGGGCRGGACIHCHASFTPL